MKLKKSFAIMLAAAMTAGALAGAFPLSPHSDGLFAYAEEEAVTFDTDNASLHLPTSYEQYLPLEDPSHVAMNEKYIAIADNTLIYVYDRESETYFRYEHVPVPGQPTAVTKIQFSDEGEMYFRDAGSLLWHFNLDTMERDEEAIHDINCQTFLIQGDYLFYVSVTPPSGPSNFYYVPSQKEEMILKNRSELVIGITANNPRMAFENDTLYCVINNNKINAYAYDEAEEKYKYVENGQLDKSCEEVANLQFVCAYGDEFFYTVKGEKNENNGLWRTDMSGNAKRVFAGDDYSTITTYGDKLYCIQGSTIREMKVTEDSVELTGYEIASGSSSPHRLANATETVRTKDLVAVADADNERISVYNRLDDRYSTIPLSFKPEHIAIDKEEVEVKPSGDIVTRNKISVSNGTDIHEYTFERHTLKTEENGVSEEQTHVASYNVKGLCYVYGTCYYITEHDGYGIFGDSSTNGFAFKDELGSPAVITSDIYGKIYVAFGNKVYSFNEEDFKKNDANSADATELTNAYTSLSVDYEGNVWHLSEDGTLYCNDEKQAQIDGKDFVFLNEEHDYPVSFALSYEDDEIYFNFENYVVKSEPFSLESLPSLNKITAGDAKEKAFELADTSSLFVEIPAKSVGFEIALDKLKTGESEYFPYESYFRLSEARRGVLLYAPDGDGYYVAALYSAELHTFTANLFKTPENDLQIEAAEKNYTLNETSETMYTTSDVSLCSAPCLYPAPKGERLSTLSDTLLTRGTKLTVLGYAEGEDRAYAYVEVVREAREVKRGFVPRSYLTKTDPNGVAEKNYFLGYLKADKGVILTSEDGTEIEITERTQAKLYKNEDGTYTAVVEKDGVLYTGIVTSDAISRGETDALRISLIVILSVLALVIIGGYIFLMFPRRKKKK